LLLLLLLLGLVDVPSPTLPVFWQTLLLQPPASPLLILLLLLLALL
jgi:hypothetical protein